MWKVKSMPSFLFAPSGLTYSTSYQSVYACDTSAVRQRTFFNFETVNHGFDFSGLGYLQLQKPDP